jgi:tripartite-type tricarboxylate transporter receptor subunit TctC
MSNTLKKSNYLFKAIGLLLIGALPHFGLYAQEAYPNKPIRLIVGFPAGSATDVAARVVANQMGQKLGQSFVVENRPGASSDIAARAVATSAPDGYTLFILTIANIINESSGKTDFVNVQKSFAPIAMIGSVPIILVASSDQNINSLKDLIAVAKSKPKAITFASSGNGTAPHLSGELFAKMADVDILHVPYKGSSLAVTDLLAGRVNIMFAPASTALPHIQSGKLVALGVASANQIISAPKLPTLSDQGLTGFESSVWFGLVAPNGTPANVISTISKAVNDALENKEVIAQFDKQGIVAVHAESEKFSSYIEKETEKWTSVIKDANVQL